MSYRDMLDASARNGNADAIARLVEPECPDAVWHLVEWARELCGRSGEGMNGLAPLTYATIRDWRETTGVRSLSRLEVTGLLVLDAAMRAPDDVVEARTEDAPAVEHRAWPTKEGARWPT